MWGHLLCARHCGKDSVCIAPVPVHQVLLTVPFPEVGTEAERTRLPCLLGSLSNIVTPEVKAKEKMVEKAKNKISFQRQERWNLTRLWQQVRM